MIAPGARMQRSPLRYGHGATLAMCALFDVCRAQDNREKRGNHELSPAQRRLANIEPCSGCGGHSGRGEKYGRSQSHSDDAPYTQAELGN